MVMRSLMRWACLSSTLVHSLDSIIIINNNNKVLINHFSISSEPCVVPWWLQYCNQQLSPWPKFDSSRIGSSVGQLKVDSAFYPSEVSKLSTPQLAGMCVGKVKGDWGRQWQTTPYNSLPSKSHDVTSPNLSLITWWLYIGLLFSQWVHKIQLVKVISLKNLWIL